MAVTQTRVHRIQVALAECLCKKIREADLPEPCFCGVLPGDSVSLDYVGDCELKCGMAWVRVTGIAPTQMATQNTTLMARQVRATCSTTLDVGLEVGVIRCAPIGVNGEPPTMAQQLDAATLQMADADAALRAVLCCLEADYELGQWAPIGPEGVVLGGAWQIVVEI